MKKLNEKVLAHGEVTGHAHRIDKDVYEHDNGVKQFSGSTTVTHEEHKPIVLPDRVWLSDQVVEFDHLAQMERKVLD